MHSDPLTFCSEVGVADAPKIALTTTVPSTAGNNEFAETITASLMGDPRASQRIA